MREWVISACTCTDVCYKRQCLACLLLLLQLHPCRFGQGVTVLVTVHTLYTTLYTRRVLHSHSALCTVPGPQLHLTLLFHESHGSHAMSTQIDASTVWKEMLQLLSFRPILLVLKGCLASPKNVLANMFNCILSGLLKSFRV